MIPKKGYATFHPLKYCMVGSGFKASWFDDLFKNKKISDPLKRIADETEEDYLKLINILESAGIKTCRPELDINKYKSLHDIERPPVNPRDHFAVIGTKLYAVTKGIQGYLNILKQINKENLHINPNVNNKDNIINTAEICRVGKDLFWDKPFSFSKEIINKYKSMWEEEGFRVHLSNRGYHSDAVFCIAKPGCIVSLKDIQDYKTEFPGWDVLYVPDQSWEKVSPFIKIKDKVGGRWWLKGEEDNNQLIEFVNTWLNDWVGYVEETVYDVNMLSIDENTIICNNYNKQVFDHFKKHKIEPIIFNFRHRYFWDGGVHCITQDLYREGKMENYIG